MVSQRTSRSNSRHRRRKAAGQLSPKRRTTPPPRVLCAHCGKWLSRSTAYRHELEWRSLTEATLAAANPLPYDYPLASPPSSPFHAHPSSSVSSFNSSELREEGLDINDLNPFSYTTFNVVGTDLESDTSDDLDVDQADNDDDRNTHAANMDGHHDIEMRDDNDNEEDHQEGWAGLGEADGFGVQDDGFTGDDDGCDGATGEGDGLGDGDAHQASMEEDAERDSTSSDEVDQDSQSDSSYGESSDHDSGTASTSEVTDSDEFAVRRWSEEEDPQPQQPGTSYHLPPLEHISTNWEVVIGRNRKQLVSSAYARVC